MSTLSSFYILFNHYLVKNEASQKNFFIKKILHIFFTIVRNIIHLVLLILKPSQCAFEHTAPQTVDGSYIISYQAYKQLQQRMRYSFLGSLTILFIAALIIGFYFPYFPGRNPQIAQAQNLYVATTGNDANDCLSPANACLTILGAFGLATAGDTINIAAGTYPYEDIRISGGRNGITLKGAGKTNTIVQSTILITWGINSFTIQDLTLAPSNAINTLEIRDGNSNITINNTIITGYSAAQGSGGSGILLYNGVSNITITNNRIYGGEYAIRSGNAGAGNTSSIIIKNNTLYGNTVHGILFDTTPADSVSIINNTIVNNTTDGITVNFSAENFANSTIRNNIIANNSAYGINFSGGGAPNNLNANYNNVFGNTLGNYVGITSGAQDISANPLFTNTTSNDYTLQSCSPSVDKGMPGDSDLGSEPAPNGSVANQGAEGGTASAVTTTNCTYYLSTTGSDNNTGISANSPWLAIGTALKNMKPGSTLQMAAGTYTGFFYLSGSGMNNFTIIGAGIDSTIINSNSVNASILSEVAANINRFSVSQLTLNAQNATNGIELRTPNTIQSSLWNISQVKITNFVQTGIILGSNAADSGSQISDITVSTNIIIGGTTSGIRTASGIPLSNLSLTNNTIINGADGIQINNNLTNGTIKNNIIDGGSGEGIQIGNFTVTGTIKNNIISNNAGYGISFSGVNISTTESYNNVYNNTLGNYSGLSAGSGDISSNPLYTDRTNQNYILLTGSPSIDTGDPTDTYSTEPSPNGCRINQGIHGNTANATASSSAACGFYVDASLGNDSNTCTATQNQACKTITQALSRASGGSSTTITVAAGTYSNETFPLSLRNGTTLQGAGASSTIIEISGTPTEAVTLGNVATNITISGFTFNASSANTNVISFTNASTGIVFTQNIIRGLCQNGITFTPASGTITNNIIRNCTVGMTLSGASTATIKNNTLYNNTTELFIGGNTATITLKNNILQHASGGVGTIGLTQTGNATVTNTYNNIFNHENNYLNLIMGSGDQTLDCRFTNATNADFTLLSGSPCFDIGDPTETDPNGSRIDIGSYGGSASAGRASGRSRDTEPPGIPSHLQAMIINEEGKFFVRLTWKDPTDPDLRLIHILRGKFPLPPSGNEYGISGAGAQSFIDREIQEGSTYQYMLRSVDKAGNISPASEPINVVLIPPPSLTDVKILERKKDGFTLGFTSLPREKYPKAFLEIRYLENETITKENFQNATRYEFSSEKEEENIISGLTLNGFKEDTLYSLAIRVHNNLMVSEISNIVSARTLDATPPGPLEEPSLQKTRRAGPQKSSSLSIVTISSTNVYKIPLADITLAWKEPSDNGNSVNSGNSLSFYEVRFSSKTITETNFDILEETQLYKNDWKPKNPGDMHEETLVNIPITTRFIAIKACDEVKNCSPLTLFEVDLLPPPTITDLEIIKEKTTLNEISLHFTPVDATQYPTASIEVRYAKDNPISEANFGSAEKMSLDDAQKTPVPGEITVTHLETNTNYFFAIKTINENGASNISNVVSETTLKEPEIITPPVTTGRRMFPEEPKIETPTEKEATPIVVEEEPSTTPSIPDSSKVEENISIPTPIPTLQKIQISDVTKEQNGQFLATISLSGTRDEKIILIGVRIESEPFETQFIPDLSKNEWDFSIRLSLSQGEHLVSVWGIDESGNKSEISPAQRFQIVGDLEETVQTQNSAPEIFTVENKPVENILDIFSDKEKSTETPSSPALQTIQKIVDNATLEKTAVDIIVPVVTTLVIANVATVSGGFNFLSYLQFLFTSPILLIARKRRKGWGVVYHSLTKKPIDLAIVRLFRRKTNQLIETRVTDKDGRYQFIVPKGQYYLTVTKPHFLFPTSYLELKKNDVDYLDLYHGDTINITSDNENIALNIPLDPREKKKESLNEILGKKLLRKSQGFIAFSGIIIAFVSFLISPVPLLFGLFGAHIILFLIFYRLAQPRKPKNWGVIYNAKTKKPVKNAIVHIFDTEFHRLLETQITDHNGRYAFLVGKNTYYMTVEKEGFHTLTTNKLDLTENIAKLDLALSETK